MVFMILIFLTSFSCFVISLIALGFILNHIYSCNKSLKSTSINETIVISGCDSGIGLELTKYFFKTQNFKIICGFLDISSDGYTQLSQLSKSDDRNRLIFKKLDLTCDTDIEDIVNQLEELKRKNRSEALIALINNAGIMTYGEFDWLTWNQIRMQIEVNLIGTIRLTRALVPYVIESRGRIINISSVNDTTVFPGLSVYSATKSALSTFSRGLGYELRKFGVHVITVRLGDFAKLTNIMSRHISHRDDMWTEMSEKKKDLYKDFFEEFNRHLIANYGMTSPKDFRDSSLFMDFNKALLAENPPARIMVAPIIFRIFYFIVELTPIWIQYHLLDLLFHFGFQWKPPQVNKFDKRT